MNCVKVVASAAILAAFPAISQAGAILFSDNFDSNLGQAAIASGAVDSSVTGTFTVTGGNVDVVGPSFVGTLCNTSPELGSCIDMDGLNAGTITSTSIALTPGNYTLAFDIFGSERGPSTSTLVTFGTFYSNTFNLASSDQDIISVNFNVLSSTSGQIVFASQDASDSNQGALVDNVSLTQNSSVPEPGSALLLTGVLPLLWWVRRRARG